MDEYNDIIENANYSHSCDIGFLTTDNKRKNNCLGFGDIVAYKNRHLGFAYFGINSNFLLIWNFFLTTEEHSQSIWHPMT